MPRRTAISSILIIVLAACAQSAPLAPQDVRAERIARLEKIAATCGLPAETLKLVGTEDLHVQPPADASYESFDCLLKALKKADMPVKMGFVGNEAYDPGNQQ